MTDYLAGQKITVNPVVVPASHKIDPVAISESENDPVVPVDAETPVFFLEGLKFFGFKRWMEGILAKELLSALSFPLNGKRELTVAPKELFSVKNLRHLPRNSRRLCRRLLLWSAISFSERETLSRKLELNSPRLAAKRSSLSASILTMMRLDFGFLSTVIVAIAPILSVGMKKSIHLARINPPLHRGPRQPIDP